MKNFTRKLCKNHCDYRKQDILYVIDGLEYGGGERLFLQLMSALKNKYTIIAAAAPGGVFQRKVEDMGILFLPLPIQNRFSLKTIFCLFRFLKKYRVSLIHSQGSRADFFAGAVSFLYPSVPLVSTLQMPVEGFDISIFRKKIYQIFNRLSGLKINVFIVVSIALKKFLLDRHRIPDRKVVLIYNGVEMISAVPAADIARKQWKIPDEAFVIGAVGRMVWQKGFEYLLRAMPSLIRRIPDVQLLLVGEGPLRFSLEEQVRRLGIDDHVIFSGFLGNVNIAIAATDLIIIPSLQEGFPMVTLEAMAMGKPIIATCIPGITEQIDHKKTGLLIRPASADAIVDAVLKIRQDKALADSIGRNAMQEVQKNYSVEKMVEQTERVYSSLPA